MTADPSVIVSGARTPMGRLLGQLKDFSGADLGAVAIKAALERAGAVAVSLGTGVYFQHWHRQG